MTVAVVSAWFLVGIYLVAAFCEFFAPYDANALDTDFIRAPP